MSVIFPIITPINLITTGGLLVDTLTGEIYGYDDKPSVLCSRIDYQSRLRDCRSVDDFEQHLKLIDRRKLPTHTLHSLRDEVDYARGEWCRGGVDCRITMPQQRLLEKLHDLVLYRNIIFMTQNTLAKALGITESNLMKKLKVLEEVNMLRVATSRSANIRKGEIKLTINPRLVFRGHDSMMDEYVKHWYLPAGTMPSNSGCVVNMDKSINMAA